MLVGVIPARKGSQRIKDKNLCDLNGKPLLKYTIEAAEQSNLEKIIITTDYDEEIIDTLVEDCDRTKYVKRNHKYCTDNISALACIEHLLITTKITIGDHICLLQPTVPLRNADDINNAMKRYYSTKNDVLLSVCKMPSLKKFHDKDGMQYTFNNTPYDYKKDGYIYMRNSAIYIFPVELYIKSKNIFHVNDFALFEMPAYRSVDIDDIDDMRHAEFLLKGGVI